MQSNKNPTIHCVKVPRVLDWVNKSTVIKLKEIVDMGKKSLTILFAVIFVYRVENLNGPFYGQHTGLAKSEAQSVLILKEDVAVLICVCKWRKTSRCKRRKFIFSYLYTS